MYSPIFAKQILCFFTLQLFCSAVTNAQIPKFSFSTGGTVNVNDLNWSIAGNLEGQSPNILSELHFDDVTSLGFYLKAAYRPIRFLELSGFYQKNEVVSGQGTDTDYAGDNRTDPTFHQSFSSNKGYLETFKIEATYIFLHWDRFNLRAGTAYKNMVQSFSLLSPELTDLQSSYRARWKGPGFSLYGNYWINNHLSVGGNIAYLLISYRAEANWNLIDVFMHPLSFAQTSKGIGMDFGFDLRYKVNDFLSFTLNGSFGNTRIFKGKDISYLKNGTEMLTQFNGARTNYYGIGLGAIVYF